MIDQQTLDTVIAVAVSFALAILVAWTHRRAYRGTSYTQDYAHTLVLVATVTAVLVRMIGINASIGIAMFAAFSIIRFPRNLGQSSDLAFVFLAIGAALVAGTGHPLAAVVVAVIGCLIALGLVARDAFAPVRSSHVLTLEMDPSTDFESLLDPVFSEHTGQSRLLGQRLSEDGGTVHLRFGVGLKEGARTATFIEALHRACGNRRLMLQPVGQEFDVER